MAALFELGVTRAADALRNGELTSEALAEALVARCAASPLNAFISLEADHLRAAARSADQRRRRGERLGPLHGVPLALKDNINTADFPTTAGTPALAAHRPKRNAPIVQRLLDAGAIVFGKPICKSLPMARPTTTRRLVRRATRTIPRASRAARAAGAPPLSQRGSHRPPSGP